MAAWSSHHRAWIGLIRWTWLLLHAGSLASWAHHDPQASVPTLRALKVDAPITVDGVLDEPFWQQAEVGTNFIDTRLHQPAALQSRVRVAYTRTHMYIAVECLEDDINGVRATERREDRSFDSDDWVEVHLDPLHNHQSKYAFFSNPLGTRSDANEGPSGLFNRGWTAEWELKAKILPDRWVFEMSLPLGIMNFERKNGQTWGFNVTRMQRRTDALSFWSYSPTDMYKPRHFGHLSQLDLADSVIDHNLEITPYVSMQTDFNGGTDTSLRSGVDVSYRLTPSIMSLWTLFPDFGQIEADADTIELRDTERFLPEKRLFFREGDELLRTPQQLYYSRRFTDIDFGTSLSGQWQGKQFAFIDVLGDTSHDDKRYGNSAVLRVMDYYRERSNAGVYLADSEFRDGYSRVLSTDGYAFLSDAWRFRYQLALADDRMEDDGLVRKDSMDFLGLGTLIYESYPWGAGLGYTGITPKFNPTLGYIPRQDIFGPNVYGRYNPRSGDRWYKSLLLEYGMQYLNNDHQALSVRDHDVSSSVVLRNDLGFRLGHSEQYHAPYDNRRTKAGVSLFTSDYWKSIDVGYAVGTFEEIDYHELSLGKNLKPFERWPIRYEFVIRFEEHPDGDQEMPWLNRVVFDYYFTDKMWLKSSLQHRNDQIHNISVIFGWEFRRRTFWYVAYNEVREEGDQEDERSIYSKVTYTFGGLSRAKGRPRRRNSRTATALPRRIRAT